MLRVTARRFFFFRTGVAWSSPPTPTSNSVQKEVSVPSGIDAVPRTLHKYLLCYACGVVGHVSSNCSNANSQHRKAREQAGLCFKCGSKDHRARECPIPVQGRAWCSVHRQLRDVAHMKKVEEWSDAGGKWQCLPEEKHRCREVRCGEWLCDAFGCGQPNFEYRPVCRQCGAQKPQNPIIPFPNKRNAETNDKKALDVTNRISGHPGNWRCKCGYWNFANRANCHQCKGSKKEAAEINTRRRTSPRALMPQRDPETLSSPLESNSWACSLCGQLNMAVRRECNSCYRPRVDV